MNILTELEQIRGRLEGLIEYIKFDGEDTGSGAIAIPENLASQTRNAAILRVLYKNYSLDRRPDILWVGAMRNKEIRETLNMAGRDDRPMDVDMYLSQLKKEGRIERVDIGLYRALRETPMSSSGA
jgi:hypothetical protein